MLSTEEIALMLNTLYDMNDPIEIAVRKTRHGLLNRCYGTIEYATYCSYFEMAKKFWDFRDALESLVEDRQ